ncbi:MULTISPECIES: hypothetical protein [Pseudomonas]|uniref:hypothetical protein n=1 Tax=Pseudomonas TaxID=286 RepID=UPI001396E829|nr:hypothetical protein [Pseudomonas fluorescens]QIA04324.1 hypothetical protein GZH78_19930 [Pseudomonas fluorescens]
MEKSDPNAPETPTNTDSPKPRYIPITGIDCQIPCLLIDREAPVDVLHGTAAYRLRSVTQLLETLSLSDGTGHDALLLQDFARVLAIPLRDSCDLMDVLGWKLQA